MKLIAGRNITLFIDIEWSQPTNVFEIEKSQILQIAGIGVSQDGTETRRFARSVCPTNPDEVTSYALELIGAQLESLLRATEKDVVINNFFTILTMIIVRQIMLEMLTLRLVTGAGRLSPQAFVTL